MRLWGISSMGLLLVLGGLFIWRESERLDLVRELARERQEAAAYRVRTEADLQALRERAAGRKERLAEMEIEHQSLNDRVANLEAQRDHLRTEAGRQGTLRKEALAAKEKMQETLQQAQLEVIGLNRLPRELRGQLEQARERVRSLETVLDEQSVGQAGLPSLMEVEGLSTDRNVFALSGSWKPAREMPLPVLLCRRDRIILEGWLHRIENGRIIGHVANWEDPSSALVKGEKVFILPKLRHEADSS